MRRTIILNNVNTPRTTYQKAEEEFCKHCKLKNLRPQTLKYYAEDLTYFRNAVSVKYADEITQAIFDDFIFQELQFDADNYRLRRIQYHLRHIY